MSGTVPVGRQEIRRNWGGGRAINLNTLADRVTAFASERTVPNWRALPFDPVQRPDQMEGANELTCARYTITNPNVVYGNVQGTAPQSLARRALLITRPPT